jgi:hypothetical protein
MPMDRPTPAASVQVRLVFPLCLELIEVVCCEQCINKADNSVIRVPDNEKEFVSHPNSARISSARVSDGEFVG